jgi:hypothetical protein
MVMLWGTAAFRLLNSLNLSLKEVLHKYALGFAAALLMTLVVFFTVKTDFRTLSDETNLLSVSNNMFSQREIRNVTEGKYYYDNFRPLTYVIPKRPFVFPFLTSILHSLTGFRPTNTFLLNYIALFLFLFGVFIITQKYTDSLCALASLFLVLSYPVVTLYAACGGFDFINAFFFFLTFTSLFLFMQRPSKEKFAFMWMMFLIIANTRYESIIYFIIVILGLCFFRFIKWKTIKAHFNLLCLSPMLMLPFFWQRTLLRGNEGFPKDTPMFSFSYFPDHFDQFVRTQFDFSFYYPYTNILNLVFIGSIGWLICTLIKNWKNHTKTTSYFQFFILFSSSILTNLTMMLFLFCGNYTYPTNTRYFIIISLTSALSPIVLRINKPTLFRSEAILLLSIVMFFLYHPIAIEDRLTNTLTLNREFRQVRKFVNELNDNRILIVYHRPGQFAAMSYGAVKFSYANQNSESLLEGLERGLYSKIITMQRINYSDQKPTNGCDLIKKYKLHKLDQFQVTSKYFLRISEVEYR